MVVGLGFGEDMANFAMLTRLVDSGMKLTKGIFMGLVFGICGFAQSWGGSSASYAVSDVIADAAVGEFWEPSAVYEFPAYIQPDFVGDMIDYAKTLIGTRYRRGGMSPDGFDCSGFTGFVFDRFGYKLNRTSRDQYTQGEEVAADDLQPGDLVFFTGRRRNGRVGHVGIVVGVDRERRSIEFIHSSTSRGVRIDSYPDGGYFSKRYIGARRIIE